MTEIRPIHESEAESFLGLLCDVFDLEASRARGIFFKEPLFDIRRKWCLIDGGQMVSILTTVPLEFGWGSAIGIAGVATRRDRRGAGLAATLLKSVLEQSDLAGERAAFLFARDPRMYQRVGFELLDEAVYASIEEAEDSEGADVLGFESVKERYTQWAEGHPDRLRRDERRWSYWRWNLRLCSAFAGGYLCLEGNVVRECVIDEPQRAWPVVHNAEWFGLRSMARLLGAPIGPQRPELLLMGYRAPSIPQMFMTDRF